MNKKKRAKPEEELADDTWSVVTWLQGFRMCSVVVYMFMDSV